MTLLLGNFDHIGLSELRINLIVKKNQTPLIIKIGFLFVSIFLLSTVIKEMYGDFERWKKVLYEYIESLITSTDEMGHVYKIYISLNIMF